MKVRMAFATAVVLSIGACGSTDRPVPAACVQGAQPLARALESAPDKVVLAGGGRLSDCVRGADDGELQDFATGATRVADLLAPQASLRESAAVELGYLIGAARRGARHKSGTAAELVRRLEQSATPVPSSRRSALNRGLAAGERAG